MSESLVENPLLGRMIGQQMALNNQNDDLVTKHNNLVVRLNKANGEIDKGNTAIDELRMQVKTLDGYDEFSTSIIAGIRGVTREILNELRRADPNNPLLEKKARDAVFDNAFNEQKKRHAGASWKKRDDDAGSYREAVYGAPGANKGGPEKSQITPNKAVRQAAGVPENHVPDREKFMSLIAQLATELKTYNPNSAILNDKAMLDVFETYALHEMERGDAGGGSKR